MLLIPASFWLEYRLRKYYEQTYGYVQERQDRRPNPVVTVLIVTVLVGAVALLGLPPLTPIPVELLGLVAAAVFLYRGYAGYLYRAYWVVLAILLLAVTFLPFLPISHGSWTSHDIQYASVFAAVGLFQIAGGILDHLLLARTLMPAPDGEFEDA